MRGTTTIKHSKFQTIDSLQMPKRSSERLKQKQLQKVFTLAGQKSALKRAALKEQRIQAARASHESRRKKKSLTTQEAQEVVETSPSNAFNTLFKQPVEFGVIGTPEHHHFDGQDMDSLGVSPHDLEGVTVVKLRMWWEAERINIDAVLPVPGLVSDLLERREIEKKSVLVGQITCAWRKSARIAGNTGQYACLTDAYLRGLPETTLDYIFGRLYRVDESTIRRWRVKQGVERLLPRSVAVYQAQKKPGEICQFRRWEYHSLMRELIQRKVGCSLHYSNNLSSVTVFSSE